jgi:hypothetical protein
MDHSGHDMMATVTPAVMTGMSGMAGMTQTATGSAAMASSTGISHGGGGMSMGGSCKISVRTVLLEYVRIYADTSDRCYGTGTQSTLVSHTILMAC